MDIGFVTTSATELAQSIIAFVRANEPWLAPIVFVLALLESIAFVSLLVPSTIILGALGIVIGAGDLPFWPPFIGAVLGAFIGDWLSYVIGYRFKDRVKTTWPFTRQPELFAHGEAFFARYGLVGYFFGRFVGPLRAVFPLICGIMALKLLPFQAVNAASAVVWAAGYLGVGVGLGALLF